MNDLINLSKPGDIWNLEGYPPFEWKKPIWALAERGAVDLIVDFQEMVFCSKLSEKLVRNSDNHSMMFFGDKIFSQEPPQATFHAPENSYPGKKRIVSVYRMSPEYFGRDLKEDDLLLLRQGAELLVNKKIKYSIRQNVDTGINDLSGYPWSGSLQWFSGIDMEQITNQTHSHCSMAVASIIANWRHLTRGMTGEDIPQPWKKLNPNAWTKGQIENYPGHWDINAVHPANFACTDVCFSNEFILIGRFVEGKQIA